MFFFLFLASTRCLNTRTLKSAFPKGKDKQTVSHTKLYGIKKPKSYTLPEPPLRNRTKPTYKTYDFIDKEQVTNRKVIRKEYFLS